MAQFRRQVIVQIGPKGGGEGRTIEGLRVQFRVSMTQSSTSWQATMDIYNPAPQTIDEARRDDALIRLFAGYDVPGLIFAGQPVPGGVRVLKQGSDRVLHIEAADGWKSVTDAFVNVTFAKGTTARQVIDEALREAGLPIGVIRIPDSYTIPRSYTYAGSIRGLLDDIAPAAGAAWRMSGEAVEIQPESEPVKDERGPLLTPTTGLVGSPTRRRNAQGQDTLECRALLVPSLRPFRAFRLESEDVTGNFTARDVVHAGDNWGTDFFTDIVGRPRS